MSDVPHSDRRNCPPLDAKTFVGDIVKELAGGLA